MASFEPGLRLNSIACWIWARVAGIAETDGIFLANRPNRTVAMDVLDQQYQMVMSLKGLDDKGLDDRLQPFAREALSQQEPLDDLGEESHQTSETSTGIAVTRFPESSDLLKAALRYTEKTRRLPRRLLWVISDRTKMESLLSRLAGMNDFLRDIDA